MCLAYCKLPYIPYAGTFAIGQAFRCDATWFAHDPQRFLPERE